MSTYRSVAALVALAMVLPACTSVLGPKGVTTPSAVMEVEKTDPVADWHAIISFNDKARLAAVDQAWAEALAQARRTGHAKEIAAEGPLLEPKAALPRAAPPPGPYLCRVVKLGHPAGRKGVNFMAYKGFNCHVEAEEDRLWIVKQTGSQRPAGRIWPERDDRYVFLGAMVLGDEKEPPAYGDDPERDLAGYVERVDAFQWRIVLPSPKAESRLDVLELVPITPLARRLQGGGGG
ncbi:DUF4893 domain-containing protein [Rhizorhapis suberifaciens]|uniref:DUF4893 domain-containing protein n=1 Tax=Rhizorhapis suberifaciens TaxID=13656 RepID=A0A840HUI4_9SPHN|nr:DUF4893 domain-containing protein [Rhizorhapis suberifaciens]MBB4641351.1 hypothetical protein [Rhizorhapis suberifaciens]